MSTSSNGLLSTADKTLWQLVCERAELTPDKQMARDENDRTLTFGAYRSWCERMAAGLHAMGISEGTAVSWILPSRFESLVLAGALSRLGAIQNPILPIYRQREVTFIAEQSRCAFMIVPRVFRGFEYPAMVEEVAASLDSPFRIIVGDPDLPEADPATSSLPPYRPELDGLRWLFYSSGTTADPNGAKHSDNSLSAANDGMQWSMQVGPTDKAAVVFPITHVGGLVWLFNAMQTGVELLMVETFDPVRTPAWLGENGCTCAGAGTVFWLAYLNAQRQLPAGHRLLPNVRIFNGGGAPKPKTLHAEMMAAFGAPLIGGWGLTESPINTMVHVDDPDDKKATTDGRPCPGVRIRTVIDGRECGPGE
ncbi:MAG: AMP-binding protein, partial [Actinomycetota bacterium]